MSLIDTADGDWGLAQCFAQEEPYRVHGYKSGAWTILTALGQNAVHTPGGAVLFGSEHDAREVAQKLGLKLVG